MPRVAALYLLSFVLASCASAEEIYPTARHGRGELRYINTIPVAIFAGTPEDIGQQHAALLAKPGIEVLQFPKRMFNEFGIGFFYPLAAEAGKMLVQRAPERYQQEIAAATDAAQLDPEMLAVANTLLELRPVGCSSLIVEPAKSETAAPLFGRNFDFPPFGLLDRYGVVTIVRSEGHHAFAAVGFPGLMGVLSGMNDAGLCVAALDVHETADGSSHFDPNGSPMMLTYRQLLEECTTVAEVEALLKRTLRTTQSNLAVCDRERGVVFEITPKQVISRDSKGSFLACTNHFRMPGLAVNHECWRYERLQKARKKEASLGVSDIHKALHEANQGEMTLQTMIFEPRELVLHLALGTPPSSAHKLHRLELRSLLSESPTASK